MLACLLLGGSTQGIWLNALLQLAGVAIIAWTAAAPADECLRQHSTPVLWLAIATIAVVALQEVPLPTSFWAHGPRAQLASDYRVLGQAIPPLPISLTPYASLSALLAIIPPLAMFCATRRLDALRTRWLVGALVVGTLMGIVLGVLQVGTGPRSPWYLYSPTSFGSAVGFFANGNHMATLLVITVPFLAAVIAAATHRDAQRYTVLVAISAVVLLVTGIALNGSLAGYALAVPVTAASALILLPSGSRFRNSAAVLAALSVIAAIGALTSGAIASGRVGGAAGTAVQSREVILNTTAEAISDYMPFGSGLGSFVPVYRLYEKPDAVTNETIVHADNDYAEVALELGVAGVALMVLFIVWWIAAVRVVWRQGGGGPFARAASIASAAILALSLVDFPLRTAAISGCFAVCLALLDDRRQPARQEPADFRPIRHLVFE